MTKYKQLTHWLALAMGVVGGFLVTPDGQAILGIMHHYPKTATVATALGLIAATYYHPKEPV